jgi:hypothetical protein
MYSSDRRKHKTLSAKAEAIKKLDKGGNLINLSKKYSVGYSCVVWWSEFLATDPEVRVRFLVLPDFLRSSGSGAESTQPGEDN